MQLTRGQKIGYIVAFGLVAGIVILGLTQGSINGDRKEDNRQIVLGSVIQIQSRFAEQRNFIRYTVKQNGLALPSRQGTVALCRRFRVTEATLLNANGQRNSNALQPDSLGQVRIPL